MFCLQNYDKVILFPLDSRVFTPKDGDNWRIAKLNLQLTDLGYSQMVEHLAKVLYCFVLKYEDLWVVRNKTNK